MNTNNPMVQQITKIINALRNSQNPQLLMQQMINNNPALRQAMQYVQQHGGNPKAVAEQMFRDSGMDINSILKGLK